MLVIIHITVALLQLHKPGVSFLTSQQRPEGNNFNSVCAVQETKLPEQKSSSNVYGVISISEASGIIPLNLLAKNNGMLPPPWPIQRIFIVLCSETARGTSKEQQDSAVNPADTILLASVNNGCQILRCVCGIESKLKHM
jgi:hypothetical protein